MHDEVQIDFNGNRENDTRRKELEIMHTKAIKLSETFAEKFSIPTLSYTDYCQMKESANGKTILLVDVRSKAETDISVVQGAISESDFTALDLEPSKRDVVIVAYCTIGHRSGRFATELVNKGWPISQVYNGHGVVPWSFENLPLCKAFDCPEATTELHVYANPFNLAHPAFTPHVHGWVSIALDAVSYMCSALRC